MCKRIYFRLDDIAPNMNWENFNRIVEIFKRHNTKPLLLVIPENRDPEFLKYSFSPHFWQIMSQLRHGGWVAGQHGYRHLYKTHSGGILKINRKSEFAGVDYGEQKTMLASGKNILEANGLKPEVFSAPAHSFDRNTVLALKENGFRYLSDGIALYPFKKWGLVWLPQTMWRPRKILFGAATVAIHLNTMSTEDLNYLESFIKENREIIGDFSELMKWQEGLKTPAIFVANQIFRIIWRLLFTIKHGISG